MVNIVNMVRIALKLTFNCEYYIVCFTYSGLVNKVCKTLNSGVYLSIRIINKALGQRVFYSRDF